MKIIALVPVKNESWALPSYLSSVSKIADHIIALDDSSTDSSKDILQAAGATVVEYDATGERLVNMGKRRQRLLELGRDAEGTHFIWLDADETFSANFVEKAKEVISKLQPGEKLAMRWVHAWKNTDQYLSDIKSPFGYIWKDFIFCDDGQSNFKDKFLSESRTPGEYSEPIKLKEEDGIVLHWQFTRWKTTQYKQALYRCIELIKGERSARRINHTYSITLDDTNLKTEYLKNTWVNGIVTPDTIEDTRYFHTRLIELFSTHGIKFFEPLEIWHIPELKELFQKTTGYTPKLEVFPKWLIYLNAIKNKIFHD